MSWINISARQTAVAALIFFVISIVITKWVGDLTAFDNTNVQKRAILHEAILKNQPPNDGTWSTVGANSLNIRVATVWFAEEIHQVLGLQLSAAYRAIDLVCLFVALHLLWVILKLWYLPELAFAGVLLFSTLLPLTMLFGYFQPWDRPSLALWAGLILTACKGEMVSFLVIYLAAILIKFDAVTAVSLIVFLRVTREHYLPALVRASVYFIVGVGLIVLLLHMFPGGQEARPLAKQFHENLRTARSMGIAYPPLLTHGVLILLGLLGWSYGNTEQRRLWLCGGALLIPHMLFTNAVEVRAQVASIFCMLPLALRGVLIALSDKKAEGRYTH